MKSLADGVLDGEQLAAARLIRDIDDHMPGVTEHLQRLYPHTGRAQIVGITGNPGCGKSTLVDALIRHFRQERGLRVGVVAVDPSSPFSGGAILGDRIRMQRHALDDGVFIRSMASRGHLGGLSRSTSDAVVVLDAMGFDVILIETVGVGQAEVDIVEAAHVSVVVVVPGLGDEVQAIKAGVLEIADLFCVNKADREGADRATHDLEMMLSLRPPQLPQPPIMPTVASTGRGIAEMAETLMGLLDRHDLEAWEVRRVRRARHQLEDLLRERVTRVTLDGLGARLDELVRQVAQRERDPYTIVDEIIASL
jgi:GTPase